MTERVTYARGNINKQSHAYKQLPVEDRIRLGSVQGDGGCRTWLGYTNPDGYGEIRRNGKVTLVHRAAWEAAYGPIVDNLTIDHICRNRACNELSHLRLLPHLENCRRQVHGPRDVPRKEACKHGHPFDEANTYEWAGTRSCRTCRRGWSREAKARRLARQEGSR